MTTDQHLRDAALATPPAASGSCRSTTPSQPAAGASRAVSAAPAATPAAGRSASTPAPATACTTPPPIPPQLARWWQRWPHANIGLVTGDLADVLDVDGPAGRAALRRWATQHALRLEGPLVRTGSGWHHYLAASGAGNRTGLLEGVDWRGRGGYVIAPPSLHANGSRYRWLRPLTSDLPCLPGPLRTLLLPARQLWPQAVPPFREAAAGHPYGRAALQRELAAVAGAPKGRRNHTLYQAGIRLYSLVAGGVLDHAEVQAGLLAAADAARLLPEEPLQTRRTLASAERTGLAHPRGIPTRDQAPRHPPTRPPRARPTSGRDDRERDA